jgi:RNA polymerase sigma-70 factor (ECF subfamily)
MDSSLPHTGATRTSLLSRVRKAEDHGAWREFEDRYRELLLRFCRKRGLQHADAEDVVQTVFVNLTKTLPQFVYDPQRGRFRDYLYRCTRNVLARWSRRPIDRPGVLDMDADCADPADNGAAAADGAIWQEEWVAHHYRLALMAVRAQFNDRNIELFERNVNGESIAALATAYRISEDAIYQARRRIRERLQELIAEQVRAEDGVDDES